MVETQNPALTAHGIADVDFLDIDPAAISDTEAAWIASALAELAATPALASISTEHHILTVDAPSQTFPHGLVR